MITLIEGAEIYSPAPLGCQSLLVVGGRIARVGSVDRRAWEALDVPVEVIDARDTIVTPGLIDPHEHLLGGSGEDGFATQTPEIALREVVEAGITTVVGCLGVDTTTKTMAGLLARARAFQEEGLTALLYSGGYNVPPVTLTGTVRSDILFLPEVIGAGETAIADRRSTEPALPELARLVRDAYVGGLLTGKAGITHFHVGEGRQRLSALRALLEQYEIAPECLYPTHVERSEALMDEAVALSRQGVTVDVDTVEHDLPRWFRYFLDNGGDAARLTASSDAAINSPATLPEQLRSCVREHGFTLEQVLPLLTSNTARVLKLHRKGQLREGLDADIVLWNKSTLAIRDVIVKGRKLVENGVINQPEKFLKDSNRRIHLDGEK